MNLPDLCIGKLLKIFDDSALAFLHQGQAHESRGSRFSGFAQRSGRGKDWL